VPELQALPTYFAQTRDDVVAMLPRPLGRVLDVGCGSGGVGPGLRAAGATALAGVEIVPEAAALAAETYDDVRVGAVEEVLPDGPFDTVLCLDVLEHLVDPDAVLAQLADRTAPGGFLQVSVPNARHVSLLRDLVLRGTFGYGDWGHRDRTHLRWFTRTDIAAAVERAGFEVVSTSRPRLARTERLDRLSRGLAAEFLTAQWYVGARRRP
jgi:2-polyprenyl-3-methyl-5-hydroxy-6-metoxy-1,4-benzoquinol methylase